MVLSTSAKIKMKVWNELSFPEPTRSSNNLKAMAGRKSPMKSAKDVRDHVVGCNERAQ